jgi:signal transduction histidine kinase
MVSFDNLRDFISYHKDYIHQEMRRRFAQLPKSRHGDFSLKTKDGERRLDIWLTLVIKALEGDPESFFIDQERVGYIRAAEFYEFNFAFDFYNAFREVVFEILQDSIRLKKINPMNLYEDFWKLDNILFRGYANIASTYLKTREDKITAKITHLNELYNFTNEIITTFNLKEIVETVLRKIVPLFGVEKGYLVIYRGKQIYGIYTHPVLEEAHEILSIMENSWKENAALFMDESEEVYREVDLFHLKRVVSAPIRAYGHCLGAFALINSKKGFKFKIKELDLLNQFLHVSAIALENAFMIEEIEQNRQEMRLLTGKLITIQEEERRRLASDIHDTIAQTLTGVSYKIQFCKELARKKSSSLMDQLDVTINMIHQSIDQSRELISSLRPDLLDTIGLSPALKRFLDSYTKETGIVVSAQLPKEVQVPPDIRICLFRVAQEALTNVYKHADTKTAKIVLEEENGNVILVVDDDGEGFDMSQGTPWMKHQNKLGLLSMKERVEATGGSLLIDSKIHGGCRIEAKIPLKTDERI